MVASRCDEETVTHPHPQVLALERARAKAHGAEVTATDGDAVVLGADTVVALGSTIFGKPADRADARNVILS